MRALKTLTAAFGLIVALATAGAASAGQTNVAVAANFTEPAKEIAAAFKAKTGHEAILSFGSSGQLLHPDHAGRAVPGLPVGRRGAAQEGGRRAASASPTAASPTRSASSCSGARTRAW